jgi:hypothetical protein
MRRVQRQQIGIVDGGVFGPLVGGHRATFQQARPERTPTTWPTVGVWWGAALATFIGLALGALTDIGQSHLPWYAGSLANSAGSWVLATFLVALGGSRVRHSVARGALCMVALNVGFYLTAAARDIPLSASSVVFWLTAALVFGPIVGLSAGWVRHGGAIRAGIGAGTLAGFLVGESVYALRYLSQSTTPGYWEIQLLVAAVLGVALAWRGSRRPAASLFTSALACTVVAGVVCALEISV